jgi:hypothetical protein
MFETGTIPRKVKVNAPDVQHGKSGRFSPVFLIFPLLSVKYIY